MVKNPSGVHRESERTSRNMPSSQLRPPTSELLELHVFYVPEEVWNFRLNTVPVDVTNKFLSAGFIRVSPHMTLRTLREQLREHLGEDSVVKNYTFLKCIGGKLAMVKAKQEMELKLRSFAPPYAFHPELYLLPGVENIYSSSSSTPERPLNNMECVLAYTSLHKSHRSAAPDHEGDQNAAVLESAQKNHFSWMQENEETHSNTNQQEESITPSYILHDLNSAEQNSVKTSLVKTPKRKPLNQAPPKSNHLRKGEKYKGSMVNQNSDQEKTEANLIQHKTKEDISIILDANMENGENAKGRRTTGDSGIPESLEDKDLECLYSKKSQQHPDITKSLADTGGTQDNQTDENNKNNFTHPNQYLSPPTPPLLALSINRTQAPNRVFSTDGNQLNRQLQHIKAERKHLEKTREELIKKVKGLLEQNKLRRYHARDIWKKKYFETKKITASLEEVLNKLQENLDLHYQKLLMQLQAREVRKRGNRLTPIVISKNNTIIQITTLQHDIEQLRRKLDNAKMKLVIEIKMRKQATSDLQALKAELAHKKVQSSFKLQSDKQVP
ncbi:spermatogenesis-associated protein 1 [Eublepharis macularius]|uniref:Spermatogenesis-associated protein 1 n=1 Tax=Eublepharis macularius TaxID=481883 RepID=A0AA97KZG8_EUBMA|nr:spermatogenesis-associated protein 1 [Eublepharis macularius]